MIDEQGAWAKEPTRIIDRRVVKKGNNADTKVLVEWTNSFPKDATWESLRKLKATYPTIDP